MPRRPRSLQNPRRPQRRKALLAQRSAGTRLRRVECSLGEREIRPPKRRTSARHRPQQPCRLRWLPQPDGRTRHPFQVRRDPLAVPQIPRERERLCVRAVVTIGQANADLAESVRLTTQR